MISHKKLLPLVETGMDYPEEYLIKIYDIWGFEQSQFQNIQDYDKDFAFFVLNKIEEVIQEYGTPDFEIDPKSESHSYQLNKLERYTSRLKDIRERIALGFFFAYDKCYSYSNEIIISRNHSDYLFWFSLKLRQYDLNLQKTASFLAFHLEKNFNKNRKKFIELVEISLDQYPEFFSDRLRKTIDKWILSNREPTKDTLESNNVVQIDNKTKTSKESKALNVAQTDNEKKGVKKKVITKSKFQWINSEKSEKQLTFLCNQLINNNFISNITVTKFKNNFAGKLDEPTKINWVEERFALIHLLNELKNYLNPEIYTIFDGTIGVAYFAPHFLHNGEEIITRNWTSAKSRLKEKEFNIEDENTKNSINLIITELKTLA
jgi:hypothetical protein